VANQFTIFLAQRFDRERVEYLCDLEDCSYALLQDTVAFSNSQTSRPFVMGRADNHLDLKALSSLIGGTKNLILETRTRKSTFPLKDDCAKFFASGGIAILEDNWHDLALRRILRELARAQKNQTAPQIHHHARIVLHKLGFNIHGITHSIGYQQCTAVLFNASNLGNSLTEFSIHIAPGVIAHGKCKVIPNTENPSSTTTSLEFVEFDGVSRDLINDLVNSEFTLQKMDFGKLEATDKDHFTFLEEAIRPFLAMPGISFELLSSPFDNGCFAGNNPFLLQFIIKIILRTLSHFPVKDAPKHISLQLKENFEKELCLFITIPTPSQVAMHLNNNLVVESHSPLSALVAHEDLELLRAVGLRIEQYPDEPLEHLAICLEEVF
jgi:hypothetical protein